MEKRQTDVIPSIARSAGTRRGFVAGAMAMGISATAAMRLATHAQTPVATGAEVDYNELGNDQVTSTFPLVEEKATFTVLIPSNDDVGSFEYDDNAFTRWYEDLTNVHIEWQVIPREEAQTGLNVRLAGGDYAEILMSFNPTPAVLQLYGGIGVFQRLNDHIEAHGKEFGRVVEQYPLALTTITGADGNIYSLPYVNDCFHCAQDRKLFIYQPWLDSVGLEVPTTTEEFHAMLKAFKDGDPNGNGEADELPFATCINSWNNELDLTLMNSFVFNPGEPYLYNQDGTVTASYATEGWKEGSKYLAQLYADGLIDPESFTQTADQLIAKTSGEGPTRVGVAVGGSWGVFVQWDPSDPTQRWAEYKLAPPFKGPGGVQISAYNPYLPFAPGNFIVTDKCSNPELAVRWADGLYDLETTFRSVSGVPGEQWRWANEGELGINGEQALWSSIPQDTEPGAPPASNGWVQTGPSFRSASHRAGEVLLDPNTRDTNLDVITQEVLEPYRQPAEMWLQPMYFNEDQVALVAETQASLIPFVKESFVRWITGQGNPDEEWESYLEQLEGIGLQPYLEAFQTTLDTQSGR